MWLMSKQPEAFAVGLCDKLHGLPHLVVAIDKNWYNIDFKERKPEDQMVPVLLTWILRYFEIIVQWFDLISVLRPFNTFLVN